MSAEMKNQHKPSLDEEVLDKIRTRKQKKSARYKTAQIQKMWHTIRDKCVNFKNGKCALGDYVCRPCDNFTTGGEHEIS